jgi:alpha-glucuronidase
MKTSAPGAVQNEDGYKCWLRYAPRAGVPSVRSLVSSLTVLGRRPILDSARDELLRGIGGMFAMETTLSKTARKGGGLVLGTIDSMREAGISVPDYLTAGLSREGFVLKTVLKTVGEGEAARVLLAGKTEIGALYSVFRLLSILCRGGDILSLSVLENPKNPLRMIQHWDNIDGSVERGYAGRSIFFSGNRIVKNPERIRDYARLMASLGINGVSINNVNVHDVETRLVTGEFLPGVARIAGIFRAYGIRLFLSINYASPIQIGGLSTADPLDPGVREWWKKTAARIYGHIPDFGGFVVKADSEGRPGPFTYGRSHADGANMLADALARHGGLVLWRCFVYNCRQDWRDRSTDRARAAVDHFKPLDGKFADGVLLQIKNGPMDFQVREPVSPLFGGLEKTNQVLELQITQEYTGQQRDLCCLAPQWKEYLDFETYARGTSGAPVKRIVDGSVFGRQKGGVVGVSNVGDDRNWTGHDLAQANLFAFGRLAWDPDLPAASIVEEWADLTFSGDSETKKTIAEMLLESWSIYESYAAPLGVGWMVNPGHHYGPNVDGYEYSRWGTYHFADCHGIGVDRGTRTGTGFTSQYKPPNSVLYDSRETCPEEFLLFFHHVPYSYRLKSGKTLIQHIYDIHFEGAERAARLLETWRALEGKVDGGRWNAVRDRFEAQCINAMEWRDVVNAYFFRKSGIPDEKGRRIF